MILSYHEIRNLSPEKAREIVRKVFQQNNCNISKTAKILGISRKTVRRAINGPLHDLPKKPHSSPNKTPPSLENLITLEAKRTGFSYRRLKALILRKYSLSISENTIKSILKRNNFRKTKKKRSKSSRHLYDYEALLPFQEFQLDTKHLLDKNSLPTDVYNHLVKFNLPQYEWNIIDVKTRTRFTAYSFELNSTFGFSFVIFVVLWLRAHNVRHKISIRVDNGEEFCLGSERKLREWNSILSMFDVELKPIPKGAKYLMGIVENSHRQDDEYFLGIHAERCKNVKEFLVKAQRWQDTWNIARPSFGIGMDGKTPYEKLISSNFLVHPHIFSFPVILMEDLLSQYGLFTKNLSLFLKSGTYVLTKCQKPKIP